MAKTDFSIGQSTLKPAGVIEAMKSIGGNMAVVADLMTISSLIPVAQAKTDEVDTIVGTTLRVVEDPTLRDMKLARRQPMYQPRVFAKNFAGMQAIFRLLTRANTDERFYVQSRLGVCDLVADLKQDVVVTTGDFYGLFASENWRADLEALLECVPADSLYVELVPIPNMLFDRANSHAITAINEYGLKPLVTHPLLMDGDMEAFVVNMGIANRSNLTLPFAHSRPHYERLDAVTLRDIIALCGSAKERISARFGIEQASVWKDGLTNSVEFFEQCAYRWEKLPISLPQLSDDPDLSVKEACKEGLKKRIKQSVFGYQPTHDEVRDLYIPRLKYELDVLSTMGFCDYFLVVSDLVNWAKESDIIVGPGRGSVGGSLVAYLMGITDVDPIRFDLLFERFINPSRNDLPDADLDFMSSRREEVITYLEERYGKDRVAGISNYTELGSASGMKDVARVYGMDTTAIMASKLVPAVHGQPVDLETARKQVADIDMWAEQNPEVWRNAVKLQGTTRSLGKHAAGIITSGCDIIERAAIERRSDQRAVNWNMDVVEQMGLVKLDILGLSTLDTIGRTLNYIELRHGSAPDLADIDLADEATLAAFSSGDTVGIFQFEGGAARRILTEMSKYKNVTFDDIVAANALNRPGPIEGGLVRAYIDRRNGEEFITYPHEKTEGALEATFGVMVYQEQIMRIAVDLCGFTLSEADTLRKVVGKKKKEAMAEQRDKFVDGAVNHSGMPTHEADELFDMVDKFAGYGFNKSHAVEYSLISFQMMWLKTHYPVEFYAGALSTVKEEKLQPIVNNATVNRINILPPDINLSDKDFVIKDDKNLLVPFNRVKGVSDKTTQAILNARADTPFASVADLTERVERRLCNVRHRRHLDLVGAFASIEPDQLGPLDMSRLKDQIMLMPGLTTRPLPAARTCNVDKDAITKLAEIIEEMKLAEEDVDIVIPSLGKNAKFAIVADAPAWSEENSGKFGDGKSAQYVRVAMAEADLQKSDVYWTGILKRLKDGKMISTSELRTYAPFINRELEVIRPPVIVTLGATATRHILPDLKGPVNDLIGQTMFSEKLDATVVIGFNPAQIFHNPDMADKLVEVFETAYQLVRK